MPEVESRTIPINRPNLIGILGNAEGAEPDPQGCEICATIPEVSSLTIIPSRDESSGGYPAAFARLERLIDRSDRRSLLRCPLCGRLYLDEYDYDFLVTGSEDEYTLRRLTRQDALALFDGLEGAFLARQDDRWVVTWQGPEAG